MEKKYIYDELYIIKKIGSGSFGDVYVGIKNKKFVAIKIEDNRKNTRLIGEVLKYRELNKGNMKDGIPKIYSFIKTSQYNFMVMDLLGPSLDKLFILHKYSFDVDTVFNIGYQIINLIEKIHNIGIIHRDIKPNNFLIDTIEMDKIYIMDLGLSKRYIDSNNVHRKQKKLKSLIGTPRYMSINVHKKIEPSRRDDMESIGYMLIYFLRGELPWQGLKSNNYNKNNAIGECKKITTLNNLCDNIPCEFKKYLWYCRNLQYDETPDYRYLKSLFEKNKCEIQWKYSDSLREFIKNNYYL